MAEVRGYLEGLAALAHAEGGWGYVAGQAAHLEPTCLALLALSPKRKTSSTSSSQASVPWRSARSGWSVPVGAAAGTRPSGPLPWCSSSRPRSDTPGRTCAGPRAGLLALRGRVPEEACAAETIDIDSSLVGWPWAEQNFSWAEPTAWACLALRRAGQGGHPRVRRGRAAAARPRPRRGRHQLRQPPHLRPADRADPRPHGPDAAGPARPANTHARSTRPWPTWSGRPWRARTWNTCAGPSSPWTLYRDRRRLAGVLPRIGRADPRRPTRPAPPSAGCGRRRCGRP